MCLDYRAQEKSVPNKSSCCVFWTVIDAKKKKKRLKAADLRSSTASTPGPHPVQEYLDICSSLPSHRRRPTRRLSPVQNSFKWQTESSQMKESRDKLLTAHGLLATMCVCNRLNRLKERSVLQGFMAGYGLHVTPFRAAIFSIFWQGWFIFAYLCGF